jgi:hypothetical protein
MKTEENVSPIKNVEKKIASKNAEKSINKLKKV